MRSQLILTSKAFFALFTYVLGSNMNGANMLTNKFITIVRLEKSTDRRVRP